MGPVVVWNSTKTCNLKCMHCYMGSDAQKYKDELTTDEAKKFIDDLADFRVPVLLFSGGEPLIRPDFFELAEYAQKAGVRPTLSTNGTLITREVAQRIKDIGVGYVGISLDGLKDVNDKFRGVEGAYEKAMKGIENCVAVGQRVGLRFTINQHNAPSIISSTAAAARAWWPTTSRMRSRARPWIRLSAVPGTSRSVAWRRKS